MTDNGRAQAQARRTSSAGCCTDTLLLARDHACAPLNASNVELGPTSASARAARRTARTARVDALLAAALERQAHPESYEHEPGEPVERSLHAGASAVSKAARRPCISAFLVTSAMSTPGVMITIAATARNGPSCTFR
jgi:hypothetical protein